MKILFALIFVATHHGGIGHTASTTTVRIGAYEKLGQCKEQGKILVRAMTHIEIQRGYFFCVPVNL